MIQSSISVRYLPAWSAIFWRRLRDPDYRALLDTYKSVNFFNLHINCCHNHSFEEKRSGYAYGLSSNLKSLIEFTDKFKRYVHQCECKVPDGRYFIACCDITYHHLTMEPFLAKWNWSAQLYKNVQKCFESFHIQLLTWYFG